MARRRAFPAAVLTGLVLLHVAGAFAFRSWAGSSTSWADPSRYVIWTLTLGQCGLLAWWVGVTRVRPVWKLAGWCTGTALLVALLSRPSVIGRWHAIPWKDIQWGLYLGFSFGGGGGGGFPVVALIMVAFSLATGFVLRRRGIHLITPFTTNARVPPRHRFANGSSAWVTCF